MKNQRIGLLTIHDTLNYGSLLQTYSLYEAIKSLNKNVELIDYKCKAISNRERTYKLKCSRSLREVLQSLMWHKAMQKKYLEFWNFIKDHMELSTECNRATVKLMNNNYDTFVVGSDIVWGMDITGNDFTYFLDFVESGKRKIAFSSSIGTKWPAEYYDYITYLLKKFDVISVREKIAAEWIKNAADIDVAVTCDPTMLWENKFWNKFIDEDVPKKKYVLVYLTTDDKKNIYDAKKYAKKCGYEVYYINFYTPIYGVHNIKPVRIEQWLSLIKSAETIFTASYHGLLFSLYFHKNVWYYNRANTSRMISLCDELKISHREGTDENIRKNKNIDYSYVDKVIENKRMYSWNLLKERIACK